MISVIMPSFNQAEFIGAAIDSVFNQGARDVELIICDGGSVDNTVDILKARAKIYSTLHWISEPDNGPADALNKALSKTRGTIIGWLNSDDLYTGRTFDRTVSHFRDYPNDIMVYGQGEHIDISGKVIERYPTLKPEVATSAFRNGCFICQPTVFFRRSMYNLLGPLDESYRAAFDYEYWLRAFGAFNGRIGFIDAVQAQSRLHESCITKSNRGLVAREGARVTHQYFGCAPIHWLTTYIEESLVGAAPSEKSRKELLSYIQGVRHYYEPGDVAQIIKDVSF